MVIERRPRRLRGHAQSRRYKECGDTKFQENLLPTVGVLSILVFKSCVKEDVRRTAIELALQ